MAASIGFSVTRRAASLSMRACGPTRLMATEAARLHGSEIPFLKEYKTQKEVGPVPLGGQEHGGPFFTGDATDRPTLPAVDTSGTVGGALDSHAERTGQRVAVVIPSANVKWSFLDLKSHVDAAATGLMELGVSAGAKIAVMTKQPAERLTLDLAAARIGASLVECASAAKVTEAVKAGAKVAVFDGADSEAASTIASSGALALQSSGKVVSGAFSYHDIFVYGPLFPDPLESVKSGKMPAQYKDLLDGKKISL